MKGGMLLDKERLQPFQRWEKVDKGLSAQVSSGVVEEVVVE